VAKQQLEFDAVVSADQVNKLLSDLRSGAEGAAKAINDAFGGTVNKKIFLETVTDDSGARQLVAVEKERLSVADRVIRAQEQAQKLEKGSVTSLRQQVNQAKQARDEITRYSESTGALFGTLRRINPEWAAQNQRVAQLSRQLDVASASTFWDRAKVSLNAQGLISFGNGLVQITQGLQAASILLGSLTSGINEFVNTAAKLQSFELSFVAAGAGRGGAAEALSEASRIALGLGANLNNIRDGFQRLTPVVLNSGGTIQDVSGITEALSSRFAAFGLNADASRRVMNGVIQAFAKGKLQAEELTQQISEADSAFKVDFATALGVTVQQLEELVKNGQITSQVLIETLPQIGKSSLLYGKLGQSAGSAAAALAASSVTITQVQSQLQTLNQLSFERLATSAEPLIAAFFRAQAIVVDFFDYVSRLEGIQSISGIINGLAQSALNVLDALSRTAQVVLTAIGPFLRLAEVIVNSGPGIAVITTLIGARLLQALVGVVPAVNTNVTAFGRLVASIATTTASYLGLGNAAASAGTKIATAQASIAAASVKQFSLFGDAGDIAGTTGQIRQLSLALDEVTPKRTRVQALGSALGEVGRFAGRAAGGLKTLAIAFGPTIALTATIAAVTDTWSQVTSQANDIVKETANSLAEINQALAELAGKTQESGDGWSASTSNVGAFQAGLDRLRNAIGLATAEEAKYNRQTIANVAGAEQRFAALDQLAKIYTTAKNNNTGSTEALLKENKAYAVLSSSISSRISAIEKEIALQKTRAVVNGQVDAAKQRTIAVLQGELDVLRAMQVQYGLTSKEQVDYTNIAKKLSSEVKTLADAEIENLRKRRDQINTTYGTEINRIDELKRKRQEARQAEAAEASERIRLLRQLTPAEQKLENIRIQNLAQKAGGGDLEAQAQLERIAREREIAAIEEEERQKEKQAREEERKADKEIAALKKQSKAEEKSIDEQILALQEQIKTATDDTARAAGEFTGQLQNGQTAAQGILDRMRQIKEIASTTRLGGSVGQFRFAGGSVTGGGKYTVNELGQEAFLSSSGRLSAINARPWGQWRAPSSGTVIPAHIAAGLDIPSGGVQVSRNNAGLIDRAANGSGKMARVMSRMVSAVNASLRGGSNSELAAIQANQALQIGKLGRAVDDLASKDWNVNVRVRNTGSAAYLEALNHRL
jgi:tape measure domain-containing protein